MRRISLAIMISIVAATGAAATTEDSEQSLTVYINAIPKMPALTLPIAEGIACEIFSQAGVHIVWKGGWPKKQIARQTILVNIESYFPANLYPGALAYTRGFEGVHITVFYDRVENSAPTEVVPKLLGHVLAHEITHILEGVNGHSLEGVMKAHWSATDILSMAHKILPFDPSDVQLIHMGMPHPRNLVPANANLRPKADLLP